MDKKNLRPQETHSTKDTGEQHLGMVELSDEALSQVWGGCWCNDNCDPTVEAPIAPFCPDRLI